MGYPPNFSGTPYDAPSDAELQTHFDHKAQEIIQALVSAHPDLVNKDCFSELCDEIFDDEGGDIDINREEIALIVLNARKAMNVGMAA